MMIDHKEVLSAFNWLAKIGRLRASNAELLAAAKRVVDTQDEASRKDGDARLAIKRLQAAIAKAEKLS